MAQNDLEWLISPDSQLFQSFPTEVAQNDSEQPILPDSQLFQSFPTEVAQNDSEWPILPDSQLFQSFPTEVAQNGQFHPICNFFHLFPPKWLRMTRKGQFCPICNFSNLFPPKWLRMTWNGEFCPIHNFPDLFPLKWPRITYDWPLCWSIYKCRVRLQDWLHSGDEFPIAFKVNYISEDLLLVMATSRLLLCSGKLKVHCTFSCMALKHCNFSSGSRNLSEGGGPMTRETCGPTRGPSFFLIVLKRGGAPGFAPEFTLYFCIVENEG